MLQAKREGRRHWGLGLEGVGGELGEGVSSLDYNAPLFSSHHPPICPPCPPLTTAGQVREGQLATAEGVSYLEAKHLLLLHYCTAIVFYLLLKAEGRPVKDHPVIGRLVEIRAYLVRRFWGGRGIAGFERLRMGLAASLLGRRRLGLRAAQPAVAGWA